MVSTPPRPPPPPIRIGAPAKVNLDLCVLHRRPDGYHEVRTILQSIALEDTVSIRRRPGPLTVRSRTRALPRDEANLVWQAAARLWRALGRSGDPCGVAISLRKAIPTAAGLGGASSDAAAALRGLCAVWADGARSVPLEEVAGAVGSDVPFFLRGGTVAASGRGERLRAIRPLDPHWAVLAMPRFGVSTPSAYRWWDEASASGRSGRRPPGWRGDLSVLRNDLEPVVARRHPELGSMIARLRAADAAHAAMSGSGSAVFGLFRTRDGALSARAAVRRAGWRTRLTRTIGAEEFTRRTRVVGDGSWATDSALRLATGRYIG